MNSASSAKSAATQTAEITPGRPHRLLPGVDADVGVYGVNRVRKANPEAIAAKPASNGRPRRVASQSCRRHERSIASHLVTRYFSAAVLTQDAIPRLGHFGTGNYHDYVYLKG
jgi:hypothetical protein